MGGDPNHEKEHIFAILPMVPTPEILDQVKKKHPYVKITFHFAAFKESPWRKDTDASDDGEISFKGQLIWVSARIGRWS